MEEKTIDQIGSVRWMRAMQAMHEHGSLFMCALACAWDMANPEKHAKLMSAFAEEYEKFALIGEEDAKDTTYQPRRYAVTTWRL